MQEANCLIYTLILLIKMSAYLTNHFKVMLAVELLFGSIFLVKTVLFTKHLAARYRVSAIQS